MHTHSSTWELPSCSSRFSNCMGAHVAQTAYKCSAVICAALAGYQTAWVITSLPCCSRCFSNCIQVLFSHLQCSGRIPNCMYAVAVALLQCSGRIPNCMGDHVAALLQPVFLKLHSSPLQSFAVQWQDTKLHVCGGCCSAAVQWQDTKLHG
jgi:hypothetical protein